MSITIRYNCHRYWGSQPVNIFKNLRDNVPKLTRLDNIIEVIHNSIVLEQYTMDATAYYYAYRKKSFNEIKHFLLPAFSPAALMQGGTARKNLTGLTGMCFLDFHHIENEQIYHIKSFCKDCPSVLLASRSISGKGVHIFVPYSIEDNEPEESQIRVQEDLNKEYRRISKTISSYFLNKLNMPINERCLDAECLCVIAYDADLYVNKKATPISIKYDYYDKQPILVSEPY